MKHFFLLPALMLLFLSLPACKTSETAWETAVYTDCFDTVLEIRYLAGNVQEVDRLHAYLLELHQLFDIYNRYPDTVNLAMLNACAGGDALEMDARICEMLSFCVRCEEESEGAVNPMMGSVLRLWKTTLRDGVLPDADTLQQAREHTAIDSLVIDREKNTVRITDPLASVDVGAIAKGYAGQMAVEYAKAQLPAILFFNLGGNVCTVRPKPDGQNYRIAIQNPRGEGSLTEVSVKAGQCVVSSGDYQRYRIIDGVRYHHIIDPATGMPTTGKCAVSVIGADSGIADFLSTALLILPDDRAETLLSRYPDVWVLLVDADGTVVTKGEQTAAQP